LNCCQSENLKNYNQSSGDIIRKEKSFKDSINGWQDYTEHVTFNADGTVILKLKDALMVMVTEVASSIFSPIDSIIRQNLKLLPISAQGLPAVSMAGSFR
jgi:hypothetical protein